MRLLHLRQLRRLCPPSLQGQRILAATLTHPQKAVHHPVGRIRASITAGRRTAGHPGPLLRHGRPVNPARVVRRMRDSSNGRRTSRSSEHSVPEKCWACPSGSSGTRTCAPGRGLQVRDQRCRGVAPLGYGTGPRPSTGMPPVLGDDVGCPAGVPRCRRATVPRCRAVSRRRSQSRVRRGRTRPVCRSGRGRKRCQGLARQDQRIGQLVRVRPHVEAQIALRDVKPTQERRIRVQVCGRVPVHDAGSSLCAYTTTRRQSGRGQVGVQRCTECPAASGRRGRRWHAPPRRRGHPGVKRVSSAGPGILCVPTGFDVHHGSDAGGAPSAR